MDEWKDDIKKRLEERSSSTNDAYYDLLARQDEERARAQRERAERERQERERRQREEEAALRRQAEEDRRRAERDRAQERREQKDGIQYQGWVFKK